MFTLMLRAYTITAVIFLVFSVQPSAAEDCNEQNGCVQHCGTTMQPYSDDQTVCQNYEGTYFKCPTDKCTSGDPPTDPNHRPFSEMTWERCSRLGNQNVNAAKGVKVIKTVSFQAFNEAGVISIIGSEQDNPKQQAYECRWDNTSKHNSRRPYCSHCKTMF
ncbi:hypothetical protein PGT21_003617 [Puccinia graminis f. sp. tritici]|uniref:Secreted protein n=2 Tax=Puccinia graminis f. sp. tritici TaxID=56615 RepID=E3L247_PUCGT|nr:uncharacterized protein PGTG_16648 [Puccinia graminis f. sp. tritici CRL 75-36-700-3]EFP90622.2 hypothetical protein PGTG_16648 [Puccinia graminis f. sp. tritici CRL 75-36-700-3]KAA1108197.1 hypothetical protein PGT21_003617 [Puccinia graminis f. sp. tritici]